MSDLVNVFDGQCRLTVDSTSQISLQRLRGGYVPIKPGSDWIAMLIPSSAPTLANTGLTAGTLYYIYAFDNSGTLALEASVTGHATDSDFGVEVKSGDATRTLVGMVYMDTGTPGTFVNSTAKRYCLNWFNRRTLDLTGTFSADRTTTSTSYTEINSEIRLNFLTWADESVHVSISGGAANGTNGQATSEAIGIDSTSSPSAESQCTAGAANQRQALAVSLTKTLSEGQHFATLLGGVSGGTSTWWTATNITTGTIKTRMFGSVRG